MKKANGNQTREIIEIIREKGITEYAELMDYLMDSEGMAGLFDVASRNTLFFVSYLERNRES